MLEHGALDGAVAVIASEATRSRGTRGSLCSLDCFVAPLLAMKLPPEFAVMLAFQRVGDCGEGARSQHGIGDRVGERQGGGGVADFGPRLGLGVSRAVPQSIVMRRRDEGRRLLLLSAQNQHPDPIGAALGRA